MWSDDLDNEMRRAAQEESAGTASRGWEKMEAMLDEHLPVEKKKRRFFFFWWLAALLLVGGTAYLLLRNNKEPQLAMNNGQRTTTVETVSQPAIGNRQTTTGNQQNISSGEKTSLATSATKDDQAASSTQTTSSYSSSARNNQSELILFTNSPAVKRKKQGKDEPVTTDFLVSQNGGTVGNTKPAQNNTTFDGNLSSYNNGPVTTATGNTTVATSTKKEESPVAKTPAVTTTVENKKEKKEKPSSKNKLSLLLSAGPDLSSIGSDKQGRWKMQAGVGLQYQFSKRFSIRTGFYASRKIYEVKPKDYNPPAYFWQYYPDMQKIDADCKVYEVPLMLVFDVTKNQKNNFYVTAGSSTYIMNKEVYGYSYKDNLGYDRYAQRTAPEKSIDYFSSIGVSAGYSRQLSKRVSVSVEPYLKIPVSGIGYGKVKLTNGGALINGIIRLGKN